MTSGGIEGVVMEKSRVLMKLAPRIQRLESDTAKFLVGRLESLLAKVRMPNVLREVKSRREVGI